MKMVWRVPDIYPKSVVGKVEGNGAIGYGKK